MRRSRHGDGSGLSQNPTDIRGGPIAHPISSDNLQGTTAPVLPGGDWVVEFREPDVTVTVYPLVGWRVDGDRVTPLSARPLDTTSVVRPRTDDDSRLIATTAARLRPQPKRTDWSIT